MEPSLKHLVLITEDKPEIIGSETIFEIEVPAKGIRIVKLIPCLLYTSDAADE